MTADATNEWRPIATAPKDGTVIRVYIPGHPRLEGMRCRWDNGEWDPCPQVWILGPSLEVPDPTHWMPDQMDRLVTDTMDADRLLDVGMLVTIAVIVLGCGAIALFTPG